MHLKRNVTEPLAAEPHRPGEAAQRLASIALAAMLAASLSAAPLAAFADDENAADAPEAAAEDASPETSESAGQAESDDSSSTVQHGLYAAASQTVTSNEASFVMTAAHACGAFAEKEATIVANALSVRTRGDQGAAVATGAAGGNVSLANSELVTSGPNAPLFLSAGIIEADNVTGSASKSPLAFVEDQGALLIADSSLESSYAVSATDALPACGVALFSTETADSATTGSQSTPALFQASGSSLKSAAQTGSFFYLTNTAASIVLDSTDLSFADDSVKLLTAAGSDAAGSIISANNTTTSSFGTAGTNGATVTFTALDQQLAGSIEVDSISSLDLYLLEGSTWKGTCGVTANSAGTDLANNIVVSIDASSGWVVTEDATVSTLNIAKGGSLVDAEGKAVTIVDADGNKLVDGASDVKVSVTNEFSTTVKTSSANALRDATIDRTAFDEEYGTSTAFGTNGSASPDEQRAAELQAIITAWFLNL